MNLPVLPSIFGMTLLMLVGLFFFIRASVKDRTETWLFASEQPETALMPQLKQYFSDRAYRVVNVDSTTNQVTFEGIVRPSIFLAVFLTLLAALGLLCLVLVLATVVTQFTAVLFGLVLLSPLAGMFYWQRAKRPEQVSLKLTNQESSERSLIQVIAHRDEVAELQRALQLKPCND